MSIFPHCVALAMVFGPAAPPSAAATEASTAAPAPAATPDSTAVAPEAAATPDSTAPSTSSAPGSEVSAGLEANAGKPAPSPQPAPTVAPASSPTPVADETKEDVAWQHRQRNLYKGLTIGGFTTFGVVYGVLALGGGLAQLSFPASEEDARSRRSLARLTIPLAGPFTLLPGVSSHRGRLFLVGLGLAQVVPLAVGIAGAVKLREFPDPDKRAVAFHVLPTKNGAHMGMSLRF